MARYAIAGLIHVTDWSTEMYFKFALCVLHTLNRRLVRGKDGYDLKDLIVDCILIVLSVFYLQVEDWWWFLIGTKHSRLFVFAVAGVLIVLMW